MSWDAYCGTTLAYCNDHADQVAIVGLNDGKIWTMKDIQISDKEAALIAGAILNEDASPFQENGINVGGQKFTFLRHIDNTIYLGKLKEHGSITLQKTKQTIVIAHTKEGSQVGVVNSGVARICEYLEGNGY